MSYLNYSLNKILLLLIAQFKIDSFLSIIIASILFGIVLWINRNSKLANYLFISINTVLICFILYLYFDSIISFNFNYPLKNINVYFLNSIICLILTIFNKRVTKNKMVLLFYIIIIIGIVYSLYMTIYLKNVNIIVIGNILPEIFFGNILIVISYIYSFKYIFDKKKVE